MHRHLAPFGSQRTRLQPHPWIGFEQRAVDRSWSGKRLKGHDPRLRFHMPTNQRKLTRVGAHIDHEIEVKPPKESVMLDCRPPAMAKKSPPIGRPDRYFG